MEQLERLRKEAYECLTKNILPFWLQNMQDGERGGWYGRMTGRGQLMKDAPRSAVLYARLLWTFAASYRVLGAMDGEKGEPLLQAATMTKDYIERFFIDREYGGVYWSVTAEGKPLETKKQFYAIGFMIYGFSEYARATGDQGALLTALELFDVVERYGWDAEYGGYIEACTREWQPIADMRLSDKDENYPKSQNTHLHIIEPYTNLLRVAPLPLVKAATERLIKIFTHHILNPDTHHLDLFFDMDWTRMPPRLAQGEATESYGHDIECSWLLHEAAMVLADARIIKEVEPVVREVARASEKGLLPSGAMIHESGDEDLHWWVQAEAIVGFFNIYQHFGDEAALEKALRVWTYVKDNLIDREHGEWYWSIRKDGSVNLDDDHAGFWKCPYHNGRMCLELIERLSEPSNFKAKKQTLKHETRHGITGDA